MSTSSLSRNQLLDLETLLTNLDDLRATAAAGAKNETGESDEAHLSTPPPPHHVRGALADRRSGPMRQRKISKSSATVHTAGKSCTFVDATRVKSWTALEQALYVVWWSRRPAYCKGCGQHDGWTPCSEEEYKCVRCLLGAGTTRTRDVVEDRGGGGDDDSGDSDDDGINNSPGGGGGDNDVVRMYALCLRLLGDLAISLRLATSPQQDVDVIDEDCRLLPQGLQVPEVLRVASDICALFLLPQMAAPVLLVHRAGLYVALLICGFPIPFVQYTSAIHNNSMLLPPPVALPPSIVSTTGGPLQQPATPSPAAVAPSWNDVFFVASTSLGIALPDFFATRETAEAFTTNTATAMMAFALPSVLWRLDKIPNRVEVVLSWRPHRQIAESSAAAAGGVSKTNSTKSRVPASIYSRLSPEHIALAVILEMTRQLQEHARQADDEQQAPLDQVERVVSWYRHWTSSQPQPPTSTNVRGSSGVHERLIHSLGASPSLVVLSDSSWANLVLHMAAASFNVHILELAELVRFSNIYQGNIRFMQILSEAVGSGDYPLPLYRSLTSQIASPWEPVFRALHSDARLPLLSAINTVCSGQKEDAGATRMTQRLLRQFGSVQRVQFNYCLRVNDDEKKHMNGLYFCSMASPLCAVYTCLRTLRKTVTYHAADELVSLCFFGAKEELVTALQASFIGPVSVDIESTTAKLAMDCARFALNTEEWSSAVKTLSARSQIVKMIRGGAVPPATALSFARDALSRSSSSIGSSDNAATLLQGGATLSLASLSRTVSRELLEIPASSLLHGISDSRALATLAALAALLDDDEEAAKLCQGSPLHGTHDQCSHGPATCALALRTAVCLRKRFRCEEANECIGDLQRFVGIMKSGGSFPPLSASGGEPARPGSAAALLLSMSTGVAQAASGQSTGATVIAAATDRRASRYANRVNAQTFPK